MMKKQILNTIMSFVLGVILTSGFTAMAQSGSTNENNPAVIRSNRIVSTVSSDLGDYHSVYYSVAADRGDVTVKISALARNGMNITVGITGDGVNEGIGPFASGGNDRMNGSVSFRVPRKQNLQIAITYSGEAKYTIDLNGSIRSFDSDDRDSYEGEIDDEDDDSQLVVVPGKSGNKWVNTGIRIQKGDIVTLDASGRVDVSAGWGIHDANGTTKFAERTNYPVNSRKRYGLAAKIVDSRGRVSQRWAYGDAREMRVLKTGTLWLTVNDDAPDDNTGEFRVKVSTSSGLKL